MVSTACHLIPPLIVTLRPLRGAMQTLRRIRGQGIANMPASPQPWPWPACQPPLLQQRKSEKDSPLWKRVSLGQASMQNSKDGLTEPGSGHHAYASATVFWNPSGSQAAQPGLWLSPMERTCEEPLPGTAPQRVPVALSPRTLSAVVVEPPRVSKGNPAHARQPYRC